MTAKEADVLLAVRGENEDRLAEAFGFQGAQVRIVRRCADLAELLAVANAGRGTAALVCDQQTDLDRGVVAELHAQGITVVGLVEDVEGWRADAMRALGVDSVCAATTDPVQLAELLVLPPVEAVPVLETGGNRGEPPGGPSARSASGPPASRVEVQECGPPLPPGRIVAVWGASGAPGRSSIAINLATELAARAPEHEGQPLSAPAPSEVLLVDADTQNPTVAQHLGLLDEAAGLALACRAAGHGQLAPARLAELAPRLDRHLRVLSGIGRPGRWPEAPAVSLDAVWETARQIADVTVIDCASSIESDEALSYDTRAPQRNGATISALGAADVVIVVGQADPIGIQRLVRALDELGEAGVAPSAERIIVVNRVRDAVVGAQPASILADALARHAGVRPSALIPEDAPAFDEAVLTGRTLGEAAPHSPARRVIADLADEIRQMHAPALMGG